MRAFQHLEKSGVVSKDQGLPAVQNPRKIDKEMVEITLNTGDTEEESDFDTYDFQNESDLKLNRLMKNVL